MCGDGFSSSDLL
jgi:hypothetical protein